jgi:hypothetical protein
MRNFTLVFCAVLLSAGAFAQATPTATLTPSVTPAGGSNFGASVAISGSTVATPSFTLINGQGASVIFVFTKPSSVAWTNMTQSATLVALPGDSITGTVAMNGDGSVIVSSGTQGVYVFLKPQGGWQGTVNPSALLTPGPAPKSWVTQGDLGPVAINAQGTTIIAGASNAGYAEHRSGGVKVPASSLVGAAYIFVQPQGGWANMTATAKLTASDGVAGDRFGTTVSISANTVAVGATGVSNFTGAAYLYNRPATGTWLSTEHFRSRFAIAGEQAKNLFGFSLAIGNSGALVAIGDAQGCAVSNPGHAFVYAQPAHSGWPAAPIPTAILTPSDISGGGCFGWVSVGESAGNQVVIVGATNTGADQITGSAYTFTEPNGGWINMSLPASMVGLSGSVYFGYSSDIGGRTFAIGAPDTEVNGVNNTGAVYLFSN